MKNLPSITETKKAYIIPISGFTITNIDLSNTLGLEIRNSNDNPLKLVIDFYSKLKITRYGRETELLSHDIETAKFMLDLIGLDIQKVEAHKSGELVIYLEDQTEIHVPDDQYETWHINTIVQERVKNTWVIGGVGSTSYFLSKTF